MTYVFEVKAGAMMHFSSSIQHLVGELYRHTDSMMVA
jgi:hypothetical protein